MNKERRETIKKASAMLDDAKNIIEEARDAEQEAFDNMPENMQSGDRGTELEANIQYLSDAMDAVDNATSELDSIP